MNRKCTPNYIRDWLKYSIQTLLAENLNFLKVVSGLVQVMVQTLRHNLMINIKLISCASKLMTKRKCWLRHAYCAFETRWNGSVLVFINSNKWFRASNCFNWISSGIVTDQISPIRLFVERGNNRILLFFRNRNFHSLV